jgi:hypothetical protein
MSTITIGNRSFETPILVPSVSSFETQLSPASALRLQCALQEPISLISAYDLSFGREKLVPLCKEFRRTGVLLLDSGGYESLRISAYSREREKEQWTFSKYIEIASEDIHDLIFSFDCFIENDESFSAFSNRLLREIKRHAEYLDIAKLIPVLHLQALDGVRSLDSTQVVDLFASVASQIDCQFIAVPERELGAGIITRATLTHKIATALRRGSRACSLHILGCGNLLSFSLFAVAGAMMCDGLEWCRTFAADNFHLHHFQQAGLFIDPDHYAQNAIAELILEEAHLDYRTTVSALNLLTLQNFTNSLHVRLRQRTVNEFVRQHFGETAGAAVRTLEI